MFCFYNLFSGRTAGQKQIELLLFFFGGIFSRSARYSKSNPLRCCILIGVAGGHRNIQMNKTTASTLLSDQLICLQAHIR